MTRLRPAVPADVDALVVLEERCFAEFRMRRSLFVRHVGRATRPLLVLEDEGGALVGYVSLLTRRGLAVARIFSIAVDPAARARGAGRALLAAAEDAARALGCASVRLEVDPANARAIGLYAAAGYARVCEVPDFYGEGRPCLVYLHRIDGAAPAP